MKLKKLVSTVLAVSLIASAGSAFADTWRRNHRNQASTPDRSSKKDIYYEDFSTCTPGTLPAGFTGGSNDNGFFSTAVTNVGGGVEKNCLYFEDTNHTNTAGVSTPSGGVKMTKLTGIVGIEVKFKYVPTSDSSKWSTFLIEYHSPEGIGSRIGCSSSGGTLNFNYGGNGSAKLTNQIVHDNWYTANCVIDYDNQKVDCEFTDHGTNTVTQVLQAPFYKEGTFTGLTSVMFRSAQYGGSWYIDYIRIYEADGPIEEIVLNIPKGSAQPGKIPAPTAYAQPERTNILLDGRYKYTTKAPKLNDGKVLVTANNIASFFNLAYYETKNEAVIKGDNVELTIAKDGSGIKNGNKAMKLTASPVADGGEVFIPIEDIALLLGYTYNYDVSANVATILTQDNQTEETEVK